ncbi:MAG: hypothetical protein ACP5U1_09510, partial [Desulfomonilaceae bacterium]
DGDSYHVVSPVDSQIAKGVMACNRPTDGTPFGGYSNWFYFRIPPYPESTDQTQDERMRQALLVSRELVNRLRRLGIAAIIDSSAPPSNQTKDECKDECLKARLVCQKCGEEWNNLAVCLRDPNLNLHAYHACVDDFHKGSFVFVHKCGGFMHIPVRDFVRKSRVKRNMAGLHACPGFCYYERSLKECSAFCEGSCYRRIAVRIGRRRSVPRAASAEE